MPNDPGAFKTEMSSASPLSFQLSRVVLDISSDRGVGGGVCTRLYISIFLASICKDQTTTTNSFRKIIMGDKKSECEINGWFGYMSTIEKKTEAAPSTELKINCMKV